MLVELWKDVTLPGDESGVVRYKVSNLGRVLSMPNSRFKTERVLKAASSVKGNYPVVNLTWWDYEKAGWRQRPFYVHHLVLEAFVGPRPSPKHHACHNDGNPQNNCITNLRWDSVSANQDDRVKHGTSNRGEQNGMNRYPVEIVREVKRRLEAGEGVRALSAEFDMPVPTVKAIRNKQRWEWL